MKKMKEWWSREEDQEEHNKNIDIYTRVQSDASSQNIRVAAYCGISRPISNNCDYYTLIAD